MVCSPSWREGLQRSHDARLENLKKQIKEFVCQQCGEKFTRKPYQINKGMTKYCTHKCYGESLKTSRTKREKFACEWCGKEGEAIPSIAKKQRFCSYVCWRFYFAERFDSSVQRIWQLGKVQNFDEFLTQEKLPCLFENCDWSGDNLAIHVNHVHGITADEFKDLCGFNRGTSLVSPETLRRLCEAQKDNGTEGFWDLAKDSIDWKSQGKYDRRPETIEHMKKRWADSQSR
jgi:hypothetical protein